MSKAAAKFPWSISDANQPCAEAGDASGVWRGLMHGSWSLIESLEANDGHRVLIARRNTEGTPDPEGLTSFESQVIALAARAHPDTLIASQLGAPEGTVSASLSCALRKLKIRGRLELVRQLGSRCEVQRAAEKPQRESCGLSGDEDQQAAIIPMPEGACVSHFGSDVAIIEFRAASMMLPLGLTDAEEEIAILIFKGATTERIAHTRGSSVKTIGNQLGSIYRKLGVSSRFELVLHLRFGAPADVSGRTKESLL